MTEQLHCRGSRQVPAGRHRFDGSAACVSCGQPVHVNRDGVVALHRPPAAAAGHR